MPTADQFVVIAAIFALAGGVKGIVGMGLPTVGMGLLGLLMPPAQAAALIVVPSLVTNLWQMFAGKALRGLTVRLATMMLGIAIGTALGIGLLTAKGSALPAIALGAILMLYAVLALARPHWSVPAKFESTLSPLVGLVTGLLTGATGVFAVPAVPYLSALDIDAEQLVQALGLSFTVSTLALAVALAGTDSYPPALMMLSAWAVVPAVVGMFVGQRLRRRLDAAVFRRWFLVSLLAIGAFMALRAAFGGN